MDRKKDTDIYTVTAEEIMGFLPVRLKERYSPFVEVWDCIGSTNDRAAQIAKTRRQLAGNADKAVPPYDGNERCGSFADCGESSPRLCIIVAREQTAGRGTRGRKFFSPQGSGIYMSVLFMPEISGKAYPPITAAAAVAVCGAIDRIDEERGIFPRSKIKWVNDIFIGGRKVCGILSEGAIADGNLQSFTVGIGLNVSEPDGGFPEELRDIAGAAFEEAPPRGKLIAYMAESLIKALDDTDSKEIMQKYRDRSTLIGRSISVEVDGVIVHAGAEDINDEGHLIVRLPDGTVREIISSAQLM